MYGETWQWTQLRALMVFATAGICALTLWQIAMQGRGPWHAAVRGAGKRQGLMGEASPDPNAILTRNIFDHSARPHSPSKRDEVPRSERSSCAGGARLVAS